MKLNQLKMSDFRNHSNLQLEFNKKITAITGLNGVGKTNVLEAIYLMCMCKTYLQNNDALNIQHEQTRCVVFAQLSDKHLKKHEAACQLERGKSKIFRFDGKEYRRLSEHIGKIPVVFIAPSDRLLVDGNAEERRKMMDLMLVQQYPDYLQAAKRYQQALDQRNRLLRDARLKNQLPNADVLQALTFALEQAAPIVHHYRKQFIAELLPVFEHYFQQISDSKEQPALAYQSPLLLQSATDLFEANLQTDINTGRTTAGIHRDELPFFLNGFPLKSHGSQGQIKSFLIALKLAQYKWLYTQRGIQPLLLIDELFEKLDAPRLAALASMLASENFGQVVITDTQTERVNQLFENQTHLLQCTTI